MNGASQPSRMYYRNTGGVGWPRFVPLYVVTLAVCAGLAWGMNWLYDLGEYYVMIVPLFAGAAVGGIIYLAVRAGHCRSREIALICGLLAGSALYLGYFYVGMVGALGPKYITRVDILPRYIRLRMAVDEVHDSNTDTVTGQREGSSSKSTQSNGDDSEDAPSLVRQGFSGKTIENWLLFTFEFGLVLLTSSIFGFSQTKRPFCEKCRDWMQQDVIAFMGGTGAEMAAGFHDGKFGAILEGRVVPIIQGMPYAAVAVDYCAAAVKGRSMCPAYFSIKEIKGGKMQSAKGSGRFDTPSGAMVIDHIELTQAEALVLSPLFPTLASIAVKPTS